LYRHHRLTQSAIPYWQLYIPPALSSRPSALARIPPPGSSSSSTDPAFTLADLEYWIEFQTIKDKAVSKDTWSLFIDFIRSIDGDFKEYDEGGESSFPKTSRDRHFTWRMGMECRVSMAEQVQLHGHLRSTILSSLHGKRKARTERRTLPWFRIRLGVLPARLKIGITMQTITCIDICGAGEAGNLGGRSRLRGTSDKEQASMTLYPGMQTIADIDLTFGATSK
jgi:hypothetical protein